MQKKIIVANWKMNPATYKEAERMVRELSKFRKSKHADMIICPPFTWLTDFSHKEKNLVWGAQDVFWFDPAGPFTGEISPAMLKNSNVKYVIIGHSERRKWLNESDDMINAKVKIALKAKLRVILCVGEDRPVRKKGFSAAKKFVAAQLKKDLRGLLTTHNSLRTHLIIAYEPIWAIGTGIPDDPKQTAVMAKFIKQTARILGARNTPVLYGGSVTSKNINDFVQYKDIDGALVGSASLKIGEFEKIVKVYG